MAQPEHVDPEHELGRKGAGQAGDVGQPAELGRKLAVDTVAEGGGTDAAFASLNTKAPVIERFGLQGFGAHSNDAEYIALDSIEPRLYLLARLIMDVSEGKDRR